MEEKRNACKILVGKRERKRQLRRPRRRWKDNFKIDLRERILHKNYDRKCSVEKKMLVVGLKGLVAKTN
jgi:hypothetical protein